METESGSDPNEGRRFRRFNGMPGQSDIIGILPKLKDGRTGIFFACEVKGPGGKVSEAQEAFLDRVTEEGGVATVVHSVDELASDLAEVL